MFCLISDFHMSGTSFLFYLHRTQALVLGLLLSLRLANLIFKLVPGHLFIRIFPAF